jgi:hypothetical protein
MRSRARRQAQPYRLATLDERLSPNGHFQKPFIHAGSFDVASTQTPNGTLDTAQRNITISARVCHHMALPEDNDEVALLMRLN